MTTKEILFETLNALTSEEFEEFKSFIKFEIGFPPISSKRLKPENTQNIVDLMVKTCGQECLKLAIKVLRKMNKTDLVQRIQEKNPVDKQQLSLIQRVERMTSIIELLLETLADLGGRDFKSFKEILNPMYFHGHCSDISLRLLKTADMQDIVFLMVRYNGQQSVEKTKTALGYMNKNDLVQRLSHGSSGPQKKCSVDEHLSALIHKVATMASVKELLLETLKDLTSEELKNFKWFLQFTFFQRSLPNVSWGQLQLANGAGQLADVIVETCGQQSVDVTMEVFMDMNRTDLVQRLSESSSGLTAAGSSAEAFSVNTTGEEKISSYKHLPGLIQKVERMSSLIELLLETLKDLNDRELRNYKHDLLDQIHFPICLSKIYLMPLETTNLQDVVFLTVQTFGQQALEKTKACLKQMRRTGLVQRLSHSSSGYEKEHSADKHPSVLIQRVATIAAVKQLLLENIDDFSDEELEKFKQILQLIVSQKDLPSIFRMLRFTENKETVNLIMQTYGQQSVELTREALMDMKRPDLFQRLAMPSSGLKVEQSVDEYQLANQMKKAEAMPAVKKILLQKLKGLGHIKFEKFKWLLQFTYFQRSLPQIPWSQLDRAEWLEILVDVMVESHGQQSVQVTEDVFMDMKRTKTSSVLGVEHQFKLLKQEVTMTSLCKKLLETLEDLSDEELKHFKWLLLRQLPRGLHPRMWMSDRVETVELIVEIYGQLSEELTWDILKTMNRMDQVQSLAMSSSGLKVKHSEDEHQPALFTREVTMTSLHLKLLETLTNLSNEDLEKFKHVLLYSKMKEGIPRIPRQEMERADRFEIVLLMMKLYGQQLYEVTMEVFKKMNRSDLIQTFSNISSGSRGRSLEREGCGSRTESSGWTKLEPEVNRTGVDEAPIYRLQSEAGNFECSVSGLRWFCKGKVSFKYQFCSWEEPMERMERMQYMPAGPLIDITVIAGKLDKVYLPHWICIDDNPKISNKFAVLHINDCGDDVEKVSEVTTSHVKLSEPVFSPRAVLMKAGFPVKISCNVLIYYKPNIPYLKLHVYLIPHDPFLQQTVDKIEFSEGYKTIRKPCPNKYLKMQQNFILTANMDTTKILPEERTLRHEYNEQNFYEVIIKNPDRDFNLTLLQTKKGKPVWTCEIQKDDYQNAASLEENHSVDENLSALMQEKATITSDKEKLVKTLEHLKQEELKKFKWFLQDRKFLSSLPCIPRSELEKGDMFDLVDLMLQTYSQDCMDLTKRVFKKINRNDLVQML